MIIDVIPWIVVGLALLGLGLSLWIVVPAPTMALLPLAVVAPEVSPLLLGVQGAIAIFTVVWFWNSDDWSVGLVELVELVGLVGNLGGMVLSSLPLWSLAPTIRHTQAQMEAALGRDYGDRLPPTLQQQMRSQPFAWADIVRADMLRSIPQREVRRDRQTIPTADGAALAVDLYRPASRPTNGDRLPLIVTIYGGAWQVGQPEDTATFSRYMAAQSYGVAAIAYRHAPDYRFPTQLEDVQTSLQWLVHHAGDYQLDPTRIALVGWSAGAHLAMLAAYHPNALPVRAVVNYYGPVDLVQGYYNLPNPDPIDGRSVLETFLGGNPDDHPECYQTASPLHWVRPGLPPTLLLYGDRDHLVKPVFGQQLDQQLKAAGNTSILIRLPWAEHAFDRVWTGMGNQIALYHVERFLAHMLRS
ncbi:MAG: alpha/beta hydrolase [Cyanothece sp. SIO2G6]|nr:alpha/beta hydrolase [Cyanothece sp. SIO2G6]